MTPGIPVRFHSGLKLIMAFHVPQSGRYPEPVIIIERQAVVPVHPVRRTVLHQHDETRDETRYPGEQAACPDEPAPEETPL